MNANKLLSWLSGCMTSTLLLCATSYAQDTWKATLAPEAETPKIHVVYFGGNDCPPCVAFRQFEFPKLRKTTAFSQMEWTHVEKAIRSPVPSNFWLPERLKPLREKLITATNGNGGSAQVVILVNGEVYDVFFGSRDAAFYENMVLSINSNKIPYPAERCLKRSTRWSCSTKA